VARHVADKHREDDAVAIRVARHRDDRRAVKPHPEKSVYRKIGHRPRRNRNLNRKRRRKPRRLVIPRPVPVGKANAPSATRDAVHPGAGGAADGTDLPANDAAMTGPRNA
jgi:hypothetical protein